MKLILVIFLFQCVLSAVLCNYHNIIEGDILLIEKYKNAERNEYFLWPNKTIVYDFDIILGYYKYRNEIEDAMKHISSLTCIRFKRRQNEINYLKFVFGEGCYSHVGFVHKGAQKLSLGYGCHSFATKVHEIMHAIGFFHHHNRPDRDEYLNINWDNIGAIHKNDFKKLSAKKVRILTPFDYKSVMLYGPREFSKHGYEVVLSPIKMGVVLKRLEDKPGLSHFDAISINKLYNCH